MKTQAPLTNMENRWVHSTKEAFDALIEMGYEPYSIGEYSHKTSRLLIDEKRIHRYLSEISFKSDPKVKQAYYHKGHFYDQPYEEFTITEDKVPFPELEDIEWVMVEAPEYLGRQRETVISGIIVPLNRKVNSDSIDEIAMSHWHIIKTLHENSKDFKVTWKLKEKINRKLHENRPLAFAIGRWLVEGNSLTGIPVNEKYFLQGVMVFNSGVHCILKDRYGEYYSSSRVKVSINDDYIIPDQVLQWMKEYDHTS